MPHDPTAIRNVALVGHHGAGKTTLAEALLAATGAIPRRGSVEKGTTTCDFEPEEISRQLSISTALAPFTVNGVKVNLLDTPGYADFASEMLTALARGRSRRRGGQRHGRRPGPDRRRLACRRRNWACPGSSSSTSWTGSGRTSIAPWPRSAPPSAPAWHRSSYPIGAEADFHGVIDLLGDTATHYDTPAPHAPVDGTVPPSGHEGPIPDELVDEEHAVHEQLVEGIVVGDDDLMERYLGGETIDYSELEKSLAGGVASGAVFPVLCCSGLTGVGVDRLARLIEELCPTPSRCPARHGAGRDHDDRGPLRRQRPRSCSR